MTRGYRSDSVIRESLFRGPVSFLAIRLFPSVRFLLPKEKSAFRGFGCFSGFAEWPHGLKSEHCPSSASSSFPIANFLGGAPRN